MPNSLSVKVEDIEDLPEFNASGWDAHLDARMRHGKCFAYALDNKDLAVVPGKANERIRQNTSMIESLMGGDVILSAPPDVPYEGNLESYAKKQWQNMVERDGLIPVAPDENGVLNVPAGTTAVFLAVQQKRDPVSREMKASRHWYRADKPREGTDQITWSHWNGENAPKRYAGADSIRDPWNQCAFDKYQPVGYFLVASKKMLEKTNAHNISATMQKQTGAPASSMATP